MSSSKKTREEKLYSNKDKQSRTLCLISRNRGDQLITTSYLMKVDLEIVGKLERIHYRHSKRGKISFRT